MRADLLSQKLSGLNIKAMNKQRNGLLASHPEVPYGRLIVKFHERRSPHEAKRIENMGSLIVGWCKKNSVFTHLKGDFKGVRASFRLFARTLLPFRKVGEAHALCTHWQIAQSESHTENYQRIQPTEARSRVFVKNRNIE